MPRKITGKPPGRPKFKPTADDRKTVELMCAVGIPHEGIARCIQGGIDADTLKKYFKEELETAAIRANTKVAGSMFQAAISGNVNAQKHWTATRMGWKETTVQEIHVKEVNLWGQPVE